MRSIRTRITALTMIAVVVCVMVIGVIGVLSIKSAATRAADQELTLLCENRSQTLNEFMNVIEQSVSNISRYAVETLDSVELMEGGVIGVNGDGSAMADRDWESERQAGLDQYLREYTENLETVFRSLANHANGVIAYYLQINPEISRDVPGFTFAKVNSPAFTEREMMDVFSYDPSNVAQVGWYYMPLNRGRPIWIVPYYNQRLNVRMLSYVTPIYKAGSFFGVIGMDIAYSTLVRQIDGLQIYDSGYAFLANEDGHIIYHPYVESGPRLDEMVPELSDAVLQSSGDAGDVILTGYNYEDEKKKAAIDTLTNGLKLIVTAPLDEINAGWTPLIRRTVIAGVSILVIFMTITMIVTKRVTEPLQRLTAASRHLSAGDYDVKLSYQGNDEVGILTSAFQQLVDHLKVYISDLNSKAYEDALTGMRNKAAMDACTKMLSDQIQTSDAENPAAFAYVMMDCNDLKKVNDKYGHEKGDMYLRTACTLIGETFARSPVFRAGGDEFVAILQAEDYENRHALMEEFDRRMAEINQKAAQPWERASISKGMAEYEPGRDSGPESVLRRADELMYRDKARIKAAG